MTAFGARVRGAVQHIITRGHDVSACGRMVIPGKGEGKRVCGTCVRLNGEARKVSDAARKAERDARILSGLETPTNTHETWSFDLSEEEYRATLEKISKLNARCANRGIPGGLQVEATHELRTFEGLGITLEKWVWSTRITGIMPQIPGWRFIATLDYDRNAGLVTRCYPGAPVIKREALREGWCDHCQTTRYRKRSFVVENISTGEQIQVGSSCIKDFTGWSALPVSFESKVQEWAGGFGGGVQDWTTDTVLGLAWAAVKCFGFVRSMDEGISTKARILNVLYPPRNPSQDYRDTVDMLRRYADEMADKARECRAWIASDEFSGKSDYVLNLKSVAGAQMVSSHNIGLLASAPQAWARFNEQSLIRKADAKPVSEWQGEIKKPLTITATVEAIRYLESAWGETTLYKLRDEAGNLYEWFASNDTLGDNEETVWTFTATVKAHKEWKGHKTTQLTRVRKATCLTED